MKNTLGTLKNLLMSLPFGMKKADSEIMGHGGEDDAAGTTISQSTVKNTLMDSLLKGEVTQEVEEFRHGMYKACRGADEFKYVGNGVAVKKEKRNQTPGKIKFTQENKLICSDVLTELKRVGGYGEENYVVALGYTYPPKIKLEKFLTSVDVVIENGVAKTTLNFPSIPNPSVFSSKPFVASLIKLYSAYENDDKRMIEQSDFNSIITMVFTTQNIEGDEMNIVNYLFDSPKLISVKNSNVEYKIEYEWGSYNRIDLTDKFFSKEKEEKYANKVKKNSDANFNSNRKWKCSQCGKEITESEAYFMKDKEGKSLCSECYLNYTLKNARKGIYPTNDILK